MADNKKSERLISANFFCKLSARQNDSSIDWATHSPGDERRNFTPIVLDVWYLETCNAYARRDARAHDLR